MCEKIILSVVGALVIGYIVKKFWYSTQEKYKDPIWTQPSKIYQDYYTRSNGSIYGEYNSNKKQNWNMFSGLNSNETAY